MPLNDFIFVLESVYFCNKYWEKFTTRSGKLLKVHRANLQTISLYPIRFSTDIPFSSLFFFF